jgi:hypothetical protein
MEKLEDYKIGKIKQFDISVTESLYSVTDLFSGNPVNNKLRFN